MPADFHVYQSLWAMEGLGDADPVARFDRVREAGFDGMVLDLGAIGLGEAYDLLPHFARTGLRGLVNAFPASVEELRAGLDLALALDAPFLTVSARIDTSDSAELANEVRRWIDLAGVAGVPLLFETHRNSITNDLLATLALLDAVPEMRLAADLSHYITGQGILVPPPVSTEDRIAQVLVRSDSFQGRIATGNHIQVPIHFPQHRLWLDLAVRWWSEGFRSWRRRARPGETLSFVCELGPPDYAMTDSEGRELSDRWEEGLVLRDIALQLWEDVVRAEEVFISR